VASDASPLCSVRPPIPTRHLQNVCSSGLLGLLGAFAIFGRYMIFGIGTLSTVSANIGNVEVHFEHQVPTVDMLRI
jgi:hypothetical protein